MAEIRYQNFEMQIKTKFSRRQQFYMTDVRMEPRRYSFSSNIVELAVTNTMPTTTTTPKLMPVITEKRIARESDSRPNLVSKRILVGESLDIQKKVTTSNWHKGNRDQSKKNHDDLELQQGKVYEPNDFEVTVVVENVAGDSWGSDEEDEKEREGYEVGQMEEIHKKEGDTKEQQEEVKEHVKDNFRNHKFTLEKCDTLPTVSI